jgi:hypothetical protein
LSFQSNCSHPPPPISSFKNILKWRVDVWY